MNNATNTKFGWDMSRQLEALELEERIAVCRRDWKRATEMAEMRIRLMRLRVPSPLTSVSDRGWDGA